MRVLDLFSGLGGWASAFLDRGHEVVTTDLDLAFGCTVTGDIRDRSVFDELSADEPGGDLCATASASGIRRSQRESS